MRPVFKVLLGIIVVLGLVVMFAPKRGSDDTASVPTILEQKELPLKDGQGLVLSVREPVTPASVQLLVDDRSRPYWLVRVFTYAADKQPGRDQPAALYEWTRVDGLKKRY